MPILDRLIPPGRLPATAASRSARSHESRHESEMLTRADTEAALPSRYGLLERVVW